MALKRLPLLHVSWEDRRPAIFDGLLYVPRCYDQHKNFSFSLMQCFSCDFPIVMEICSGNGEWILKKAQENPYINWIAVEKKPYRARKIWSNRTRLNILNLLVVLGNGEDFCQYYLPNDILIGVYVHFPDPWPKRRHKKHRIFQKFFLHVLSQKSQPNSFVIVTTDDEPYFREIIDLFKDGNVWIEEENYHEYGSSFFSRLWEKKGKEIFIAKFVRKKRI